MYFMSAGGRQPGLLAASIRRRMSVSEVYIALHHGSSSVPNKGVDGTEQPQTCSALQRAYSHSQVNNADVEIPERGRERNMILPLFSCLYVWHETFRCQYLGSFNLAPPPPPQHTMLSWLSRSNPFHMALPLFAAAASGDYQFAPSLTALSYQHPLLISAMCSSTFVVAVHMATNRTDAFVVNTETAPDPPPPPPGPNQHEKRPTQRIKQIPPTPPTNNSTPLEPS